MKRRKLTKEKRFQITLKYIIENEKVRVSELADELYSNLRLKRSTCLSYASRIFSSLYEIGVLERKNRDYFLTPEGWYGIYDFIESANCSEFLNLDMLMNRLRKESYIARELVDALRILLEVYSSLF